MKSRDKLLQWWSIAGLIVVALGAVMAFTLPDDMNPIAAILILAGGVIHIIPYFISECVYVCPKCKAQFKMPRNEITMVSSPSAGAALLTCPECKKTNICMRKLVVRNKDK